MKGVKQHDEFVSDFYILSPTFSELENLKTRRPEYCSDFM